MSRISPLSPPYAPEIAEQFDRIMRGAPPLLLFRVMAGQKRAWEKFRGGGRTCALNACEYEWGVHVTAFAEAAHLTGEEVRATVHGGADAPCWSGAEKAILVAVEALHRRSTLSEAEFAALRAHYDEAKILEIIQLCGFYRTVSYLCNSLALALEPNAARFPA
jgi:hypothetical protein